MTQIRRITGIVLALLLLVFSQPGLAQDGEDPFNDPGQFEGIQAAVSRGWWTDVDALAELTPAVEGEDPLAGLVRTWAVFGTILEFDSEPHAAAAFNTYRTLDDKTLLAMAGDPDATLQREMVADLGDQALNYGIVTSTTSDSIGYQGLRVVQEGKYVVIVITLATDRESATVGEELLTSIVAVDQEYTGTGLLNPEGGSEGGLFQYFPDDDEEMFVTLEPAGDQVLYPVEPST